mgnify:FL=1
MAIIITDPGVLIPIQLNIGIVLKLPNNWNNGIINAAKGIIIETRITLNTLSLAFDLYTSKAYPAADEIIIASVVVRDLLHIK